VNANPLAASIFSATTAGTVQHEIVKKDVDCIIAEVDRDGMCECFRDNSPGVTQLFYLFSLSNVFQYD
jgi:hypothetical protein